MSLHYGLRYRYGQSCCLHFYRRNRNKWQKGRNVNYWQVVWYVAIVVSALVVIAFFVMGTGEHLWRFAVGFGAFIALVLYILRIKYLKESPTWIINHHTLKEATEYVRNNYDVNLKLEGNGTSFSENKSSKPSTTELFKPKYLKRIVLATSISTLQGMQYYGVGLYIPIIATYIISKDKLGVLLGTAIVNIAGIIGAGSQLTYKVGTSLNHDWFQSRLDCNGHDRRVLSQLTNDH